MNVQDKIKAAKKMLDEGKCRKEVMYSLGVSGKFMAQNFPTYKAKGAHIKITTLDTTNLTVNQIAQELGVSKPHVRFLLKEFDLKYKKVGAGGDRTGKPPVDIEYFKQDLSEKTLADIAQDIGRSKPHAALLCRRYNVNYKKAKEGRPCSK